MSVNSSDHGSPSSSWPPSDEVTDDGDFCDDCGGEEEECFSGPCCSCWEYLCDRSADPWTCGPSCECLKCETYRSDYPFPRRLKELQYPLTPATLYDRCTIYELRHFVQDRGLKDPSRGLARKDEYYRVLRTADAHASFRFPDLPPEMRNRIYRDCKW
jgi:hypothetical protein